MADRSLENVLEVAGNASLRSPNWDSYGAAPLQDGAIQAAQRFLLYAWQAVPTNDGGLQLERHDSHCDIEIEFGPDGTLLAIFSRVEGR